MFESIPDYRKKVLIVFFIQNDKDFLEECGFFKNDTNRLYEEFKNVFMKENEHYLDNIKTKKKVLLERFR